MEPWIIVLIAISWVTVFILFIITLNRHAKEENIKFIYPPKDDDISEDISLEDLKKECKLERPVRLRKKKFNAEGGIAGSWRIK